MKASEILKQIPSTELAHKKLESYLKNIEREKIVRSFENCGLCGTSLQFDIKTDWSAQQVRETGHCTCCQQKTPTRIYSLC